MKNEERKKKKKEEKEIEERNWRYVNEVFESI